MSASRASFVKRIQAIRNFLESQTLQALLLATKLEGLGAHAAALIDIVRQIQSHSAANRLDRAVLDYKSVIISLYGALESLAEGLATEFISFLSSTVPQFSDLPEIIKGNHCNLSATLLLELEKTEKYTGAVTEEEIIRNLYACQTKGMRYTLNAQAYTQHGSNFRIGALSELLRQVAIPGLSQKLKHDPKFSAFYQRINPAGDYNNLKDEQLFDFLNELASRRNDIAHGAEDPGDIFSNQLLADLLEKVEVLGEALCDVVQRSKLPFICSHRAQALPQAIKVFNNQIVCFEVADVTVHRRDYLLCAVDENEYRVGEILEIRIEKRSLHRLDVKVEPVKVAFRVGYRAKQSYRYFLLSRYRTLEQRVEGDGWVTTVPVRVANPLSDDLLNLFRYERETEVKPLLLLPAPPS